ncbi:MAG: TIGR04190 family B12-binding domain/radical SAM domain protein [Anaerolineae bacterium]
MVKADLVLLHPPSVYDFRQKAILYGPISDLVPSTSAFEMYPIGFTTLAEYLERHGCRVRIVNLAVRMLRDENFDAQELIASLNPLAFGIDLHWLPHAQGALEVARMVKRCHPHTPVIMGGFSSSYYHQELLGYPEVDYVVRGDSTEEPLRLLMACLAAGEEPWQVPNLTWRDRGGQVRVNPLTYLPEDLDNLMLDYSQVVKFAARDRDLASYIPFKNWLEYPIMAGLTCRGCIHGCVTCGGSAYAFRRLFGRTRPAYRSPEALARDIRNIQRLSRGPVFVLGDIRQPGMDYAHRFLRAIRGLREQVIIEFFAPASRKFLQEVAAALPNFCLEVSLESHDPAVRRAFGKSYSNEDMERTMEYALEAGCQRLDVFFMVGLPKQTYSSVMETINYCQTLMERFGGDGKLRPFISPLAPFLDPGSRAFEHPERYGYRLFHRTLEEHRQALLSPSWKYVLNYETEWMSRDEIVASTYEAGLRLNRLKARYGLVDPQQARRTEARIRKAVALMERIDRLVASAEPEEVQRQLQRLKPHIDRVNTSTVCEKSELELPVGPAKLNGYRIFWLVFKGWLTDMARQLRFALGRS